MTTMSPDPQRQRERWQRSLGPRISAASLVLIGLALGFGASLYFAWIVEPVSYVEASPARMNEHYRAEYLLLVAQAFESGSDWEQTQDRLGALADSDIGQTVAGQLVTYLREGQPADKMRSLALLARQLGVESAAVDVFAPLEEESVGLPAPAIQEPGLAAEPITTPVEAGQPEPPDGSVQPSPTPSATPRPTPTAVPQYRLLNREQVCEPETAVHRLEVIALDSTLQPLQAAEVIVIWEGGNDHFFTGFQPERGLGYGDFEMEAGVEYTVMMAEGSQLATGLGITSCDEALGGLPGGWRLTFQNTKVQQ